MKPQDFLIGIRDFFSVVVPGAILLLLIPESYLHRVAPEDPTLRAFSAAIAAYFAGSIASAIGSFLDRPVDWALENGIVARFWPQLARREALADSLRTRLFTASLLAHESELYRESLKSFWWDHLRLKCPAAIAELDRIEAAQKLFRSLVPVFAAFAICSSLGWVPSYEPPWMHSGYYAAAAVAASILYVAGRVGFLSTAYRFAVSYCLAEGVEGKSAATSAG